MRKPWEAPDLRHLQDRRENTVAKQRALQLAESLVPEDFAPKCIIDDRQWPPDLLDNLVMDNGGIILWTPSTAPKKA